MANPIPTQTSFKPGHRRTPEQEAKRSETLRRKYATGELKPSLTGYKMSQETLAKRARTLRQKSLGNRVKKRSGNKDYWQLLTLQGYRYEHRLIMESLLGRPLLRSEHVHHRNGDGLDNRPENLMLLSHSEHSKLHSRLVSPEQRAAIAQNCRLSPGQWSRKYTHCQMCGTTRKPHRSRGFCSSCYEKQYQAARKNKPS
jgi:hypothetical protein